MPLRAMQRAQFPASHLLCFSFSLFPSVFFSLPLLLSCFFSPFFLLPASFFFTCPLSHPKTLKKQNKTKQLFVTTLLHLQNLGINVKLLLPLIRDKYKDERQREK